MPVLNQISTIWGIGRNYRDHANELGNPVPAAPIVFIKPAASICWSGQTLNLPFELGVIHHEVELAIQIDQELKICAATVALDLTARDLQHQLKTQGLPWTAAKAFKNSCGLGPLRPLKDKVQLQDLEISLAVNGQVKQQGKASDMIFDPDTLIDYLRHFFPLSPGDLILTGTPAGVGPLKSGDTVSAEIKNWVKAQWTVK